MRVLINAFMCTYVIRVCSKVTGCVYLVGGELRVGGKLGLTSGCLCVSTLYRGRLGVLLCINMSALCVRA